MEFIKSPYIAEFLGFNHNETYSESDIENAIINTGIYRTIVKALNEIVDIKLKNKDLNIAVIELGESWYK